MQHEVRILDFFGCNRITVGSARLTSCHSALIGLFFDSSQHILTLFFFFCHGWFVTFWGCCFQPSIADSGYYLNSVYLDEHEAS